MTSHSNLLQGVYLFKEMTTDELNKLNSVAKVHAFNAGDEIFSEGGDARSLYVIKFGTVKIAHSSKSDNQIQVATLATGSHFGEMAFVDGEHRSAGVTAVEKTEIVCFEHQQLEMLLSSNPVMAMKFYKALSHYLCGRLRITTNDLSFAREQNLRHF